ncbi:MAG: hypothetical protein NVSMB46_06440 [Candidatus Saccharimonadales bacterium]
MILTQLQEQYTPYLSKRVLYRTALLTQKRAKKLIKAKIRATKSQTKAYIRRQYFISTAIKDAGIAIKKNEDIFITMMLIIGILAYSLSVTTANILLSFFGTTTLLTEVTHIGSGVILLTSLVVLSIICGWILAFILNMVSFAVMDGAVKKSYRSVRLTLRRSLSMASRMTATWTLMLGIIGVPLSLGTVAGYFYMRSNAISMDHLKVLAPKLVVGGIVWFLLILMHIGLMPYVALFETKISLIDVVLRSIRLVKRRGRLFLLFSYLLFASSLMALFIGTSKISTFTGINHVLLFTFCAVVTVILGNAVLVVFYRKRKLARVN